MVKDQISAERPKNSEHFLRILFHSIRNTIIYVSGLNLPPPLHPGKIFGNPKVCVTILCSSNRKKPTKSCTMEQHKNGRKKDKKFNGTNLVG
jgi:hypothetical protein